VYFSGFIAEVAKENPMNELSKMDVSGMFDAVSRRNFIKMGVIGVAGFGLPPVAPSQATAHNATMIDLPFKRVEPNVGIIGVGARGIAQLRYLLAANARVVAICDILKEKALAGQALVEQDGQKSPTLYTDGDHAFEALVQREDIDLVIIATPWSWHVEQAVTAMRHGKHVGVEVPAATSLEDCWKLVDTSEQTRRHCIMLENCCYGYNETLLLRMIHEGILGDLLYGEGAYLHDLREELFADHGSGLWRRAEHTMRNGNLYPTHGLGPVANYMGIQRGDRFAYLVSMSTPERGLSMYRKAHLPASDPRWKEKYLTGDLNTSLIKTARGLTITVKHDVSNPHPYDRINTIAGTKGIFEDYPPRIYIDGQAGSEDWTSLDAWKQYEHPLWTRHGETARKVGGHGGMDFIQMNRFLQCMREGLLPDMDVYDAALWSSVGPLSVMSVAHGSVPVEVPDFTRGNWNKRTESAIVSIA
jgi:predicted dehydrogenase